MKNYKNFSLESLNGEQWAAVLGYKGKYLISNYGRAKRATRKSKEIEFEIYNSYKISRQILGKYGYLFIGLTKDGLRKGKNIHRLVAEAFIPNPKNKPCVNHKDGNKSNNHISNLEWVTYSENSRHALDTGLYTPITLLGKTGGLHPTAKPVVQLDKNYNVINVFNAGIEAATLFKDVKKNSVSAMITSVCRGYRKDALGYNWMYLEHYQERLQVLSI